MSERHDRLLSFVFAAELDVAPMVDFKGYYDRLVLQISRRLVRATRICHADAGLTSSNMFLMSG